MNREKLKQLLTDALIQAKINAQEKITQKAKERTVDEGNENNIRSRCFVNCLREQFERHYQNKDTHPNSSVSVASAGEIKEFLHDIAVRCVESVPSPVRGKNIDRLVDVLWQIEIEMSDRAKEFLDDLNKLGAGTQHSDKLFVVQRHWLCEENHKRDWVNEQVLEIAKQQNGRFFIAFIPHPREWKNLSDQLVDKRIEVEEISVYIADVS